MNDGTQAAREAANLVDLDSDPTKLLDVVQVGKELLVTRGALTTFSVANDVAKYFAILPALFAGIYPQLGVLNLMQLHSPQSAILSAIVFNALIIIALIPWPCAGARASRRRRQPAAPQPADLRPGRAGGALHRHQADRHPAHRPAPGLTPFPSPRRGDLIRGTEYAYATPSRPEPAGPDDPDNRRRLPAVRHRRRATGLPGAGQRQPGARRQGRCAQPAAGAAGGGAQWFQPRPSAGGYATVASGASNLAPSNPALAERIARTPPSWARWGRVRCPWPWSPPPAAASTHTCRWPRALPDPADRRGAGIPAATLERLVEQQAERPLIGPAVVNVFALNLRLNEMPE